MWGFLGPGEQQLGDLGVNLLVRKGVRPFFRHDDDILDRQQVFMKAKELPEHAFDPVAAHGFPQTPGHHQTQAGATFSPGGQGKAEMARV